MIRQRWMVWLALLVLGLAVAWGRPAAAGESNLPCVDGMAGDWPCHNVDLLARFSLEEMGGDHHTHNLMNDLWAWVSPDSGRTYIIGGLHDRAVFVDVTDPTAPFLVGTLMTAQEGTSTFRDIQVYQNYAYIVADTPFTAHGVQILDLTVLDDVEMPPATLTETAHYDGIGFGHNMWINQETGYLYILRSDTCNAGNHMVSLADPLNPVFVGCFDPDGADSDTECVIYQGPDSDYTGREICVTGSDSAVTIGDVTDKDNPLLLSLLTYPNVSRAHQGAFTEGQRYWVLSDINDEEMLGHNTRTHLLDLNDLDAPVYLGYYEHATASTDHNLYIDGAYVYMANWQAGLRVLDVSGAPDLDWPEVAYFDTVPDGDSPGHHMGAFGNYPWLGNGVVAVSDLEQGLFLLQVNLEPTDVGLLALDGSEGRWYGPAAWLATIGVISLGWWFWRRSRIA